MNDPRLDEALVHRPHTVLGCRLRPLSLGRLYALLAIESPFLGGETEPQWPDLERAVAICRLHDPLDHLHALPRPWRARIRRRFRPGTFLPEALRFTAYLNDYHSLPEATEGEGGELARAPWILRIVETLVAHGASRRRWLPCRPFRHPEYVWDIPTGEAFFRYATCQELDGQKINLLDPEERELLAMARGR